MDIRSVDLNLLPALDALLRHHSVTMAARELDMSQSALSAALARLRQLLGDELFVRTGRGLLPTARAAVLAEPVAAILAQVRDRVLQGGAFHPATAQRLFRLCLSDVGSYVLWPRIVRAVREQAPQVELQMRTLSQAAIGPALESAEVDLAIGAYPTLPSSLFQRRLFERKYVCLVRVGHPLAWKAPTVRQFAATPQVVVRLASGVQERIDEALARQGLQRHEALEMPSYLMIPPLLEAGDFLAVMPGQLADAFSRHGHFAILKLPIAVPPSTIRLHWHRRFHADAGNAWLRQLVTDELADR